VLDFSVLISSFLVHIDLSQVSKPSTGYQLHFFRVVFCVNNLILCIVVLEYVRM